MGVTSSKTFKRAPSPSKTTSKSLGETEQLIAALHKSLNDLSTSLSDPINPATTADRQNTFAAIQAGFGALEAAVLPSDAFICSMSLEFYNCAALGIAVEHGFAEIVSESTDDQGGVSSTLIEERTGMPEGKVSRIMRLLCTRGVFREIRPDVWGHSRHSLRLDSGKGYSYIKANPKERYAPPEARLAAWVYNTSIFGLKAASGFFPAFQDEGSLKSYKPTETAFNVAYETKSVYWEWLEEPDGFGARTFMNAMSCGTRDVCLHRTPSTVSI